MTSHDIEVVLFDLGGVLVELTGTTTLMSWTPGGQSPQEHFLVLAEAAG